MVHRAPADDAHAPASEAERGQGRASATYPRPIHEQGAWLRRVVRGHVRYYGVPMNSPGLHTFRFQVGRLWMRTLRRRG